MQLRYTIEHWLSPTAKRAAFYETCKRKDRAATVLWATIYNMIKGNGLLDRPIAWQMLRQFERCEISPPAHGTYRLERFKLNGETVIFRAEYI
jgi:hypothetical protein